MTPITRIRLLLAFFVVALALSGITAIPLQWELDLLDRLVAASPLATLWPDLSAWIGRVNAGLQDSYGRYPFLSIGTDWLAFGHIAIAVAFLGALKDPVRNIWVVEFGMIACALVAPWALIFGALRGLPFFWRLVECSFGVFGIIPLWFCRRMILGLAAQPPGD
jgi:hypothetical protein